MQFVIYDNDWCKNVWTSTRPSVSSMLKKSFFSWKHCAYNESQNAITVYAIQMQKNVHCTECKWMLIFCTRLTTTEYGWLVRYLNQSLIINLLSAETKTTTKTDKWQLNIFEWNVKNSICIKSTKFRTALFNFNMHLSFSNQNIGTSSGL